MKYKNLISLLMSILFLSVGLVVVEAQTIDEGFHPGDFDRIAQTGWQFLKLPTTARNAAMGGIMTGIDRGNASSTLTNPAMLTDVENMDATFTIMSWIADINVNTGAFVKNFGNVGTFGLSIIYLDYGEMIRSGYSEILIEGQPTGLQEQVEDLGTFGASDISVGLSYARSISDRLKVGGTVSYIDEKLDDVSTANWSFNVGTLYYTGLKTLRISMVGRNFGPDAEFASWDERIAVPPAKVRMPMAFLLGGAIDILEGKEGNPHLLTVAAELVHPNDGPEKLNFGAEYAFQNLIMLRAGYRYNYDEEGITAGAGINVHTGSFRFRLDYAYWDFGILESVNMFTVGIGL